MSEFYAPMLPHYDLCIYVRVLSTHQHNGNDHEDDLVGKLVKRVVDKQQGKDPTAAKQQQSKNGPEALEPERERAGWDSYTITYMYSSCIVYFSACMGTVAYLRAGLAESGPTKCSQCPPSDIRSPVNSLFDA